MSLYHPISLNLYPGETPLALLLLSRVAICGHCSHWILIATLTANSCPSLKYTHHHPPCFLSGLFLRKGFAGKPSLERPES